MAFALRYHAGRIRDFAQVKGDGTVDEKIARYGALWLALYNTTWLLGQAPERTANTMMIAITRRFSVRFLMKYLRSPDGFPDKIGLHNPTRGAYCVFRLGATD